jgi:hypothetical protein
MWSPLNVLKVEYPIQQGAASMHTVQVQLYSYSPGGISQSAVVVLHTIASNCFCTCMVQPESKLMHLMCPLHFHSVQLSAPLFLKIEYFKAHIIVFWSCIEKYIPHKTPWYVPTRSSLLELAPVYARRGDVCWSCLPSILMSSTFKIHTRIM